MVYGLFESFSKVRYFYKSESQRYNAESLYGSLMEYHPVEKFWVGDYLED